MTRISYFSPLVFLLFTTQLFCQELDGKFVKLNCEIEIVKYDNDTIYGKREPSCEMGQIKEARDGYWIVYNVHDSTQVIEKFNVINSQINGLRWTKGRDSLTWQINYLNGKFHGPYLQFSSTNKIMLFVDYNEGKPTGDYYYYVYDHVTDKIVEITKFNRKGKKKDVQSFPKTPPNKFYENLPKK